MIKKIRRILENKEYRALISNFSWLSLIQSLNLVLPLITLPYILKTIGASNYGIIILASSLLVYFQTLTDFSFNLTAVREISVHRHNRRITNYIFNKVISSKIFLIFISASIFVPTVLLVPRFSEHKLIFFITFSQLFGYVLLTDWFFQGIQELKFVSIRTSIIKILFTACIFIFIRDKEDYFLYPLFNACGYIGSGIYSQILVARRFGLKYKPIGQARVLQTLRDNSYIFLNQLLPNLYNNSTTFMLGLFANNNLVGLYGAAKNLTEVANRLIQMISRTFFPHLNRRFGTFEKFKKLMLIIGFSSFLVIAVFADFLNSFFHIEGERANITLIILALSIPFYAMYNCYGTNYFLVKRRDKLVMKNTLFASVAGFILAFPLIMTLSVVGAAINLTLSRGIMGFGLWWQYKKSKHENRNTSS